MVIQQSVGRGGANRQTDVRAVQLLLNDSPAPGATPLDVDGICGPLTQAAIDAFQKRHALPTDGRIDPSGPTIAKLAQLHLDSILRGVLPTPPLTQFSVPGPPPSHARLQRAVDKYIHALRA